MTKQKTIKIFSILVASILISFIIYLAFKPIFNYDFWALAIVFILVLHIICFALSIVEDKSIPFKIITEPIPMLWDWIEDGERRFIISILLVIGSGGALLALVIAYFPVSIVLSIIISPIAYLIHIINN